MIFTRKPVSALAAGAASPLSQRKAATGVTATTAVSTSVIGPDLVVTGNLETTGELQIEGDVQGDVYARRIVVGEQARVVGELVAEEVVVGGVVQGSIRGNSVTFQGASYVEGDVLHRKLTIEKGAYFEGKSRRTDDPTGQRGGNGAPQR